MLKKCHLCLETKLLAEFHKCKDNSDGLQFVCKICRQKQGRDRYKIKRKKIIAYTYKYRSEHKDQWKKYLSDYNKKYKKRKRIKKLLSLYNLTEDGFNKIFASQNYKCIICGKKDFPPCIDHNHITGKVRGILCMNCNCALGNFRDDITLVKKAVLYLEK